MGDEIDAGMRAVQAEAGSDEDDEDFDAKGEVPGSILGLTAFYLFRAFCTPRAPADAAPPPASWPLNPPRALGRASRRRRNQPPALPTGARRRRRRRRRLEQRR